MFYAEPTSRVIFKAKIDLDVFSLRREYFWTCSVLSDFFFHRYVHLNMEFTR